MAKASRDLIKYGCKAKLQNSRKCKCKRSRPPQHSSLHAIAVENVHEVYCGEENNQFYSCMSRGLILAILIFAGAHSNCYHLFSSVKTIIV